MIKKSNKSEKRFSRRKFIKTSVTGVAGTLIIPTIVPISVFGKSAPSNKINVGAIGNGRISVSHDMTETLKYDIARIIGVCDVDSKRVNKGKLYVEKFYSDKTGKSNYIDVKTYTNYREMLLNKDLDAVLISTPDHWHSQIAIEAALAGKHIYLQKPASLTIREGREMSDIVHRTGVKFQIGSQQRSSSQFRIACELVRNGRIGEVHTVKIGLPGDPGGPEEPKMPVPDNLDYDMWLGSTPFVPYTEKGVHPQNDYSRPGWLRIEQFGAGMITGWGAHHLDTAHWGMGTEYTGPVEIKARTEFPKSGLWNVHGDFLMEAKYSNGATMFVSGEYPNGIRFEGSEGWIFVTRGNYKVTASDPVSEENNAKALDASDPKILTSEIGLDEIHLKISKEHHGDWLDAIKHNKQPIAPVEVAHRSCTACLLGYIAMKLPGTLQWDPDRERFINNDEANSMLSRPQRYPYGTSYIL